MKLADFLADGDNIHKKQGNLSVALFYKSADGLLVKFEEFLDHGDHPKGYIIHGEFLVARAQRSALLVMADDAFDLVALPIAGFVEGLVARLVLACWNDRFDLAAPQPTPNVRIAVALVSGQLGRPIRLTALASKKYALQQRLEGGRFVLLARSDVNPDDNAAI